MTRENRKLSINKEDYIRAIYFLNEKYGIIRSIDLAKYLNVSKPSVSQMIRILDKENLIFFKSYSSIKLTDYGKDMALKLTAKHRIIELFLDDVLGISKDKIHEEAHRLEHAFSNESIHQIKKLLKNTQRDPHGKMIPEINFEDV